MAILTLGPRGSFSHEAALHLHPKKKILFASSIDEIFFRLPEKEISEAIIPIERGDHFIEESITNLMKYDFSLIKKALIQIRYHLASEDKNIAYLFSHPEVFKECRTHIKELCPHVKRIETPTMVHAAIQYKARPKQGGAIVTPFAAEHYKLPILKESIQDHEESFATFFSLGKSPPKKKEKNGSAFLIFSDPMITVAKQIAQDAHERKIPLLKLKNLLLQEGHTPLYFMEVEGHIDDKLILSFFEALSEKYLIKHLGSYPL